MSHREPRPRPRRRPRHRALSGAEGLEARRLLVATPIQVAAGLTFAIASPLPGLASTAGPAASVQTLASVSASVAPATATSAAPAAMFGPTATGPATTLSPLANDSETAVAAASEVARPQPGRSDRISVEVEQPVVPAEPPPLRAGEPVEVVPGPEFPAPPPAAEAAPAEPAPAPAPPEAIPAPAPAPNPAPLPESIDPTASLDAWDRALDLVTPSDSSDDADADADATPSAATRLAAGVVAVVAWGGYRYAPRVSGRSRQDALVVTDREAGPGRPGRARR